MCWNTYFIVFFEHQPKIAKKWPQKETITFDILQNTGWKKQKKNVLLQLPFWPKNVFLSSLFWNQKPLCWTENIT